MRIVEAAWLAQPHPDLADAYAHVRLGDSARQRLVRIETLAAKVPQDLAPGHLESALAVARAAIDATEYARAREALAPFVAAPTQRVAMLMAEIERTEHGDSGRARAWTLRAVRALHDPVWTADGYVSDRWRPVSPVTGRLDAFQWQRPLAALPSDSATAALDAAEFNEAITAPRRVAPPSEPNTEPAAATAQDNVPAQVPAEAPPATAAVAAAPPLFRARQDMAKDAAQDAGKGPLPAPPAVIPIVRAPDDPGIDDEAPSDEFAEPVHPAPAQPSGWRGFFARLGG
jgi:HemY protein